MSIRNTDKFEHPSRSSTATHIQNYTIFTRRSGEGVSVVLTSLSAYKGVMHGYLPQGNGILMLADGREFKGHFRDGEIIGKTTLRWEKIGLHHATYLQIDNQGKYNDYFKITDEDNEITRIFYDQEGLIDLDGKYRKLTPEHNFKFLNTTTGTWYINNIETREFKMIFPNKLKLTVSLDTGSGYLSDASGMIEVPITKKGVSTSYRCGFDIKYFDQVDLHKDQNGVFYWIDQEKSAARNQIIIKKVQLKTGAIIEGEFIAEVRKSKYHKVDIYLELELIEGNGVIRYEDLLFNFTLTTENQDKYIIGEGAAPWSVLEVILFRTGFSNYSREFTHGIIISGKLTKSSFIGEMILELSGNRVVLNIQKEDQTPFADLLDERLPLKIISREGGKIFDGEGYLLSDISSGGCTGTGLYISPFKGNRFYIQTKDDGVTYSEQKVLDSGCVLLIDALSANIDYFEIKGNNSEFLKGSLTMEEGSIKNAIIQGIFCSGNTTLKIEHHSGFIYSFSNETDMYRATGSKVDLWRTFQTTIQLKEFFFNFIQSPGNILGGDKVYTTGQFEHYIYALHPITEIGQNLDDGDGVRREERKIATRRRNFFVDENYGLTLEGHYKLLDYIPQEYLLKTDSFDGTIIFGDSRIRCVKSAFSKDVLEIMYRKKLKPSSMIYNEIEGVMTSAKLQVLGTATPIDKKNLPSYSTSIMYCGRSNVLGFSISNQKAFKKWEISSSNKIINLKC